MLEFIGEWVNKSKVEGSPIEDFRFGNTRVARVTMSFSTVMVEGKETTYKMFQHRIFLPGVGTDDVGFSWSMTEAKRAVEAALRGWLVETGFQGLMDGSAQFEAPFIMPDDVVVLDGLPAAPASAKIIPLAPRRAAALPPPKPSYGSVKDKGHRKAAGGKMLTRGR